MAAPMQAPLPPWFRMGDGMVITITALDANTGATVAGVTISDVSISVEPDDFGGGDEILPPVLDPAFFEGQEP